MNYLNNKEYAKELYHHGILGMKWGKKNGPPYPLDAKDHSASEKKAGWRKSLEEKREVKKEQKQLKKDVKAFNKRKSNWFDVYSAATVVFNQKLNKLNDKYSDDELNDPKKYDQYLKELSKIWTDSYKEMAIEKIGKDPVTKGYEYIDNLPFMDEYDGIE